MCLDFPASLRSKGRFSASAWARLLSRSSGDFSTVAMPYRSIGTKAAQSARTRARLGVGVRMLRRQGVSFSARGDSAGRASHASLSGGNFGGRGMAGLTADEVFGRIEWIAYPLESLEERRIWAEALIDQFTVDLAKADLQPG